MQTNEKTMISIRVWTLFQVLFLFHLTFECDWVNVYENALLNTSLCLYEYRSHTDNLVLSTDSTDRTSDTIHTNTNDDQRWNTFAVCVFVIFLVSFNFHCTNRSRHASKRMCCYFTFYFMCVIVIQFVAHSIRTSHLCSYIVLRLYNDHLSCWAGVRAVLMFLSFIQLDKRILPVDITCGFGFTFRFFETVRNWIGLHFTIYCFSFKNSIFNDIFVWSEK